MRLAFPIIRILISKFDLDAAYRRIHSHPLIAVKAITIIDDIAHILNRPPFGAAAGPNIYSTVSEMVFELAQGIADEPTWDYSTIHSPHSSKGGYNIDNGDSWRYTLPQWMLRKFHINFFEFLSSLISLSRNILVQKQKYIGYLCLIDNSSKLGWLYRTNLNPESQQEHDLIAREMALILSESETALYSQHMKGCSNIVVDSLLRDNHIPTKQLTFLLNTLYSPQIPVLLSISETLHPEITCFINSLKHLCIRPRASPPQPAPSSLECLFGGQPSWHDLASLTNTLMNSLQQNESNCSPALLPVLDTMKTAALEKLDFTATPSAPTYQAFVWYFRRTFSGMQSSNRGENNSSF